MPEYRQKLLITTALGLALGISATANADGRWALCAAPLLPGVDGDPQQRTADDTPVDITAERSQVTGDPPVYQFNGDVRLQRADQTVRAESMRYDSGEERVDASGGASLLQSDLLITGQQVRYWLAEERGRFEAVSDYRLAVGHMQGQAARIIREGPARSRYEQLTLSTCLPGDEFWRLSATTATIDTETRQGRTWNTVLSIHDLPVFYTPYLQFPVGDERLTGFLFPTIGQSETNGTTVSVPWYWNIAPNYDATLTPTSYWKRGLLMDAEFRYLQPWLDGEISGSYMEDDDRFGDDRWAINQNHHLAIGPAIRGELLQQRTSDTEFSDDFGEEFDYRSAAFLESSVELSWADHGLLASIDAQDWQRVDSDARAPYARRPRVQLGYDPVEPFGPFTFSVASEYTDFYSTDRSREQGVEYNISPTLSLPLKSLAYEFTPAVAWQHTGYDLDVTDRADATPDVSVPIYTADARVFFERPRTLFKGVYQTLEPRLNYRNVPDRDQDELPSFSETSPDSTFSRLFRSADFDIGHTEQISAGVTTRYVDERSGRQYLSASLGQTFYLHDVEQDRSDYVAELRLSLPQGFSAEVDYSWDPEESGNSDLRSLLRWQGRSDQVINLGLRRREENGRYTLNQAELSFALPVTAGIRVFGGLLEDLEADQTRERFYGIEQGGCCHVWRLISREELQRDPTRDEAELEREFMLELELRGLAGIGDKIRPFLRDEINGYNPGP
mgnify:FL=1